MRKALWVLGVTLAMVFTVACGDDGSSEDDPAVVTEGMTSAEVEEILGEPTATTDLADPATGDYVEGDFKATYPGEGGSWVSYEDDRVTGYIIGGYTGSP